jgi:hypothetical protein
MRRGTRNIVAIAVLGLVLAIGLGIFANTIARGTVALPSTSLERTERPLAPAQAARRTKPATKPKGARKQQATTTRTTTATTPTTTEAGDDHGGRGRGRGSDDSGGTSDNSGNGKGSDD